MGEVNCNQELQGEGRKEHNFFFDTNKYGLQYGIDEALYVIAGMMPTECWVEERIDRYRYGMDKKEERKYQLDKWQKK